MPDLSNSALGPRLLMLAFPAIQVFRYPSVDDLVSDLEVVLVRVAEFFTRHGRLPFRWGERVPITEVRAASTPVS